MTAVRTAVAAPEPPDRILSAADLTVSDPVWVRASGQWRRGEVTALARVRVRVRYVSDRHGNTGERWFAASPAEPVYHGGLPEPVTARCPGRRCGLLVTGRPGQSAGDVIAEHQRSAYHHGDLP